MITTDALTKAYGSQRALDAVSLSLRPGTVTGVVGPNASGKTTLMRLIAGLVAASSGTIAFNGEVLTTDQRICWCSYAADGSDLGTNRLSRVVSYASLRPRWQAARLAHLCERFAIDLRRPAHQLSTGQRSLFAAALTLSSGAPVLLLDESQATMDVPTRYALYEEILEVAGRAEQSILLSTHLVGEVETIVEDVVVLAAGSLVIATDAEQLRSRMTSLVGAPAAIDAALASLPGLMVISRRSLGPATAVVLEGHVDPAVLSHLAQRGITASPVPFQDAFAHLVKEIKR